jgi:mono/diheme cytochrome c family protein
MAIPDDRVSMLRRRSAVGVLGLAFAATLAMQPQIFSAPFDSRASNALAQGKPDADPDAKALYKQHCQLCHLDGSAPIVELNFADGQWKHGSGVGDVVTVVRDGAPGTAMLGFKDKLTEKEILALAEYVRAFDKSLKSGKPKKSVTPRD